VAFDPLPLDERQFVVDGSVSCEARKALRERFPFIDEHNLNRRLSGFCVVAWGVFVWREYSILLTLYRFGKRRHPESSDERNEDAGSISDQ